MSTASRELAVVLSLDYWDERELLGCGMWSTWCQHYPGLMAPLQHRLRYMPCAVMRWASDKTLQGWLEDWARERGDLENLEATDRHWQTMAFELLSFGRIPAFEQMLEWAHHPKTLNGSASACGLPRVLSGIRQPTLFEYAAVLFCAQSFHENPDPTLLQRITDTWQWFAVHNWPVTPKAAMECMAFTDLGVLRTCRDYIFNSAFANGFAKSWTADNWELWCCSDDERRSRPHELVSDMESWWDEIVYNTDLEFQQWFFRRLSAENVSPAGSEKFWRTIIRAENLPLWQWLCDFYQPPAELCRPWPTLSKYAVRNPIYQHVYGPNVAYVPTTPAAYVDCCFESKNGHQTLNVPLLREALARFPRESVLDSLVSIKFKADVMRQLLAELPDLPLGPDAGETALTATPFDEALCQQVERRRVEQTHSPTRTYFGPMSWDVPFTQVPNLDVGKLQWLSAHHPKGADGIWKCPFVCGLITGIWVKHPWPQDVLDFLYLSRGGAEHVPSWFHISLLTRLHLSEIQRLYSLGVPLPRNFVRCASTLPEKPRYAVYCWLRDVVGLDIQYEPCQNRACAIDCVINNRWWRDLGACAAVRKCRPVIQ